MASGWVTPVRKGKANGGVSCLSPFPVQNAKIDSKNDDRQEKIHRRRSALAEKNMATSPYRASPRKLIAKDVPATQKVSNDQLSAIIAATIEGQVKRKINSKNAFDWNLIDYLSEICTTKDADLPSFSTLANVIDASGEIYASKVDHLLMDTIKVRSDLSRTAAGKGDPNKILFLCIFLPSCVLFLSHTHAHTLTSPLSLLSLS